jgi:Cdc6-like AAA superfamily ATPase
MDESKMGRLLKVGQVFTPGAPISRLDTLSGRSNQISEILTAFGGVGQHVVLYGERGVGKTSLANVLVEILAKVDRKVMVHARVNCGSNDSFTRLWEHIFRDLGVDPDDVSVDLSPEDVRHLLERANVSLVVIDELDRLEDDDALTLLADTIKTLSDHAVHATLVLVGVADSVDELVGDHRSIERALVQVKMPRMPLQELREIVARGRDQLAMEIADSTQERIVVLSQGLPHFTHLLSLYAFKAAIEDDRVLVSDLDVDRAIGAAVEKTEQSVLHAYIQATESVRRETLYPRVLLACALAKKNQLGYFPAGAVRGPLTHIMGKDYDVPSFARHLKDFASVAKGSALLMSGSEHKRFYRFQNPMLPAYTILKALADGVITEDDLRTLSTAGFS